jgi:Tfp pilus assembly protein PilW
MNDPDIYVGRRNEEGFSLSEALIAVLVMLVLTAATMSAFNDAIGLHEKSSIIADLEQNLRAGMNLLTQDLINAGWGIPTGGLPIPSGAGVTAVNRPSPPTVNYTFSPAEAIAAVNPGAGLGPRGNGRTTDMVNILYADNLLPLNQTPLDSIAVDGRSARVNAGTPITGINNPITAGDLIAFSNAHGNTVQYVTRVDGQTMYFEANDPMNLNQPTAPQGSISLLQSGGVYPPTTATRVLMITYYLDTATDPTMPRLIRRVNFRTGAAVALVLEDMQLTYDLVDGVTNPTNVETPVAPNSPNQIRKASIFLAGRSSLRVRNSNEFLRHNLTTQVSLRSLSFIDRYR